jgi:hypothetical protein
MGGIPKSILLAVAAILTLCAVAGFGLGFSSTVSRRVAGASEEEAPIAGAVTAGATIKDAQPLPPPPPPPPPVVKPKAAPVDAASDQPLADIAKLPPPAESAPGAPPSLAPPPPAKAPAPLPADLPPT